MSEENVSDVKRSLGTKLTKGKLTPITVAGLTSIGGLEQSADTIDVTTLDSAGGRREFIAGFKDSGEVSIEGYFIPGTGKGQTELYTAFESGDVDDYAIEFPADLGAKWEFKAIVTGFSTSVSLEDPLAFSATLKVTGVPALTLGTGA